MPSSRSTATSTSPPRRSCATASPRFSRGGAFLDSTGLGVLVSTRRRAVAEGTALVVARPQRIVKNALSLARVDSVVDVYDTLDAAIDAVAERT